MVVLYTRTDFAIMLAKTFLLPLLMILWKGYFLGVLYTIGLYYSYYLMMKKMFKMERLAALDEFFMLDNDKNRANIITVVKTDKLPDYERLRNITIQATIKHPRLRHKLTKFCGEYFFKEMSPE